MANSTLRALLVEVLNKWHTVPEYVGPYGIPRELEFDVPADRCFTSLTALVSPRANPNLILRELLSAGAVSRAGDLHYRAVSRFLMVPDAMSVQVIEHYGDRMSRLASTMEHNLNPASTDRRLDRRVIADNGLPPSLFPAFESYAREKAVGFLMELDNWLVSTTEAETEQFAADDRVEAGVNVFLYATPPASDEPLAALLGKPEKHFPR